MAIFYQPANATVGDVIPFYDNGEFKPFYLKGARGYFGEDAVRGWTMMTTTDHLHFTERPTGIRGGTGCVILVDGLYHLYYCTFKQDPKRETVCHAVSKDLENWEKLPEEDFVPDDQIYELTDWRDPFVFWNEEAGEWWMLLAAMEKQGPTRRRGCTGLCASRDLHHWEVRKPFYSPHMHMSAHECPDLFKMGDWYYLIYSQYTDRFQTYYRMAKSLNGPWIAPEVDSFDTRCFYAAKSGSDGKDRYLYGWNPARYENNWGFDPLNYPGHDYNSFDWGGVLIVHKLVQNEDGTLSVTAPEAVDNALTIKNEIPMKLLTGSWKTGEDSACVETPYGYAGLLFENRVPSLCKFETDITFSETVQEAGVALQVDEGFCKGYYLSLDPLRGRIQFKTALRMYEEGGWTFPYDVEFERPIELLPNVPHHLKIFIQDTVLTAYLDGKAALNSRMFDFSHRYFGLYASDGTVKFENIKLRT